jgi:hypothetical protein
MRRAIRWAGEADRYFGPFTYARERTGYRPLAIILGSGDGDDYPGCRLRVSAFGHTLIAALPALIKPWRRWVDTSGHEWSSARGGYWQAGEREYGFSVSDGYLSVALGRVTHDSSTEQRWGYFLPWTQWRHVRRSFYGLNGEHVADMPQWGGRPARVDWQVRHAEEARIKDSVPTATFAFKDFDGEALTATTRIEEREWRRGTGWWRWLSLVWPKRVERYIDIQFSGETGKRKGSWKGGTIGHSGPVAPGDLHERAFRRYCAEHGMTFVGPAPSPSPNQAEAA